MPVLPAREEGLSVASGALLLIVGVWLFVRVWFGGLARKVATGALGA